jgi:ribonucleoside-diphosphate reductase alpha chain
VIEPKALAAAVMPAVTVSTVTVSSVRPMERAEKRIFQNQADAPSCSNCGSIMIRAGACYKCDNCGNTSGCG